MKKLIVIYVFFILGLNAECFCQQTDTVAVTDYGFADKLDSLLLDWYKTYSNDSIYMVCVSHSNEVVTDVPDSVYRERLSTLVSPIPLDYNSLVQSYITKYISKGKWFIPDLLGKSKYYFPMFEEVLDAYQLPLELKYLTIVESALNPNAVSRAGATGIWQFMLQTARQYGLDVTSYIDERRDPYLESVAAAQYLKDLYDIYGDWHLAIASYNCGPGTINNAIRRSGGKTNYWEISKYLPYETRNYVPAFIAMNYIFSFYEEHKFFPCPSNIPVRVDTVMVSQELSFGKISQILGIDIEELRLLNPQYRKDYIPARNKNYPLRLRTEKISSFIALEDSLYKKDDTVLYVAEPIQLTDNEMIADNYTPTPQPLNTEKLVYTVKSGDILGYIATWYDVNVSDIKSWNGLRSNYLKIGQKIIVYKPVGVAVRYRNIDTMSFVDKQKMSNVTVASANNQTSVTTDPKYEYYTVQSGDNPWSIANKYPGVTVEDIMKLNNISNPSSLKVGQKLKIRKKA
ncbi:MAG TPA: LysM peptidoglycan-binding domain-containing protein [Bacteroidales bacterium]|nr:LysM peptidoglycan-binding domain-containing protein [Bacteroidales bacterium]HQP03405.1 LysM peptidoglycan-binding domain-containing protein [Bacteroidales bacterium]